MCWFELVTPRRPFFPDPWSHSPTFPLFSPREVFPKPGMGLVPARPRTCRSGQGPWAAPRGRCTVQPALGHHPALRQHRANWALCPVPPGLHPCLACPPLLPADPRTPSTDSLRIHTHHRPPQGPGRACREVIGPPLLRLPLCPAARRQHPPRPVQELPEEKHDRASGESQVSPGPGRGQRWEAPTPDGGGGEGGWLVTDLSLPCQVQAQVQSETRGEAGIPRDPVSGPPLTLPGRRARGRDGDASHLLRPEGSPPDAFELLVRAGRGPRGRWKAQTRVGGGGGWGPGR